MRLDLMGIIDISIRMVMMMIVALWAPVVSCHADTADLQTESHSHVVSQNTLDLAATQAEHTHGESVSDHHSGSHLPGPDDDCCCCCSSQVQSAVLPDALPNSTLIALGNLSIFHLVPRFLVPGDAPRLSLFNLAIQADPLASGATLCAQHVLLTV